MLEKELPKKISVFPLSNAIFFPRTILPLNIFEKRYLQMVSDSMKENKLFGMVQPKIQKNKNMGLYKVGCLGKIISFNETKDNRFIIALSGITRFKITEEVNNNKLYLLDKFEVINNVKNIIKTNIIVSFLVQKRIFDDSKSSIISKVLLLNFFSLNK